MINEIMTFGEATKLWGLADGTLRHCVERGVFQKGVEYRKSGNALLITKEAMIKRYGEIKNN